MTRKKPSTYNTGPQLPELQVIEIGKPLGPMIVLKRGANEFLLRGTDLSRVGHQCLDLLATMKESTIDD